MEPLRWPGHRELERGAFDVSDQDFRLLAAIRAGLDQRIGELQRIHLVLLGTDEVAATSYLPETVYIADHVFQSGHGWSLPRTDPALAGRRFLGCPILTTY